MELTNKDRNLIIYADDFLGPDAVGEIPVGSYDLSEAYYEILSAQDIFFVLAFDLKI